MMAKYTVTAVDSQGRAISSAYTHKKNVQITLDQHAACKLAREWRKDPGLHNVQVVLKKAV